MAVLHLHLKVLISRIVRTGSSNLSIDRGQNRNLYRHLQPQIRRTKLLITLRQNKLKMNFVSQTRDFKHTYLQKKKPP